MNAPLCVSKVSDLSQAERSGRGCSQGRVRLRGKKVGQRFKFRPVHDGLELHYIEERFDHGVPYEVVTIVEVFW